MQKVTPFLWFDNNAEEAMEYYASVFPDAKVLSTMPGPGGSIMGGTFTIGDQQFMTLNGGPGHAFTEAISLYVNCETQEEIDKLWSRLTADGGEESKCGWLKDKYGLSWQIIPSLLPKLFSDPDQEKAGRAMQAMLKMKKIDMAELQRAFDGE